MVETDENGMITGISSTDGNISTDRETECHEGILIPGLINTHCHLELSHLKARIEPGTGLGGFIGQINKLRNIPSDDPVKAVARADRELFQNGIAATGDISNTNLTIDVKSGSSVYYHTFVEAFGFLPSRADKAFGIAEKVFNEFILKNQAASIVPHSPYSVSEPLFRKIMDHAKQNDSIISIHNQESSGENQFFREGTGPIASHLSNNIGLDTSHWRPTGKSAIDSVLDYFPAENKLILVHNTFTNRSDLAIIKEKRISGNTFFCICPNSNLFIEKKLPDINLFRQENLNICLGTDSLASNPGLSVLDELIALQAHFSNLLIEELILWSCLNGARALGIEDRFGSLEPGKNPGINLITGADLRQFRLLPGSMIKRIV